MKARTLMRTAVGAMSTAALVVAIPNVAGAAEGDLTADAVKVLLDNTFVLIAAVLVIFMQAGFALVEAGLTRGKNVANIMMKNMVDFMIGALSFFVVGYSIAFGGGGAANFGWGASFLGDTSWDGTGLHPFTTFIFQLAFAATAATIVSGAMAERTKFQTYLAFSVVITAFVYPVVVRWLWGGGWLTDIGGTSMHDFAGSSIVHMTGGVAALMGTLALGPRIGKYGPDGKPRAIPGHNIVFTIVGVFILLVGWFGFNPGSQLAADIDIAKIAVTTTLAAAAGGVAAMAAIWAKTGKPDVGMTGNGVLAGLVGITAGTWAVSTIGALIIGLVSGVLVVYSVLFFDRIHVDDPVGAISVHGVCGAFGTIAVGLFGADESVKGLFYGGGTDQLVAQVVGVAAIAAWVAVTTGILFFGLKATVGLRVTAEEEIAGLDVLEHGAAGYAADPTYSGVSGSSQSRSLAG